MKRGEFLANFIPGPGGGGGGGLGGGMGGGGGGASSSASAETDISGSETINNASGEMIGIIALSVVALFALIFAFKK